MARKHLLSAAAVPAATACALNDPTGALRLAPGDPVWRGFFIEGDLFVAAICFGRSFAMSRCSPRPERRMGRSATRTERQSAGRCASRPRRPAEEG